MRAQEPFGQGEASRRASRTRMRHVVISPVRNEAAHLEDAIAAVVAQTVRPREWILVNDGSTDETAAIAERWASHHDWTIVVHRPDRGMRSQGTGVIEAFYEGYAAVKTLDWQYLVKLDGDIIVPPTYFEDCLAEFEGDPSLGIGGGTVDHLDQGQKRTEGHPQFHVRGGTKIYRRECWDALGGLLKSPGWDTVDELKAQFLGWRTRTFRQLRVMHRRHTGAADGSWRNAVKNGTANYVSAYHPLFMLAKCLKRLSSRPYGAQALGLLPDSGSRPRRDQAAILHGCREGSVVRVRAQSLDRRSSSTRRSRSSGH